MGEEELPAAAAGGLQESDEDPLVRRQRVEAVLLLSRAPLSARKLSQLAGLADATEARTLVRQLNQRYAEWGRAFRAEEVAGGFQLLTRPQLAPWLRRLGHIPKSIQLTPPAMETMAIVAYRQPVLRADIEAIRGVACGEILRQLMERDLVRISGRSDELGRPYLYSTTKRFLQLFGLHAAESLPAVEISELTDWSDTPASSDPNLEQHPEPVPGVPEEESDVSTAVAEMGLDYPLSDDPQLGWAADPSLDPSQIAVAAIDDDPEDDVDDLVDDEVEDDDEKELDEFDDDDEWDDDDDEEEDDEEAEADEEDADADAEWEEVDDEWVEEDEDEDEWEDEEGEDEDEDDEEEEEWD